MGIERKNSFHLLLSDDELKLLRLLAERDGLNASDYLRSLLRQMAGAPSHVAQIVRLQAALGGNFDFGRALEHYGKAGGLSASAPTARPSKARPRKASSTATRSRKGAAKKS